MSPAGPSQRRRVLVEVQTRLLTLSSSHFDRGRTLSRGVFTPRPKIKC